MAEEKKCKYCEAKPKCPQCGQGSSLVLRDYEDGYRLVCGANCGLMISPMTATGLEFDLNDFAKFFAVRSSWSALEKDPQLAMAEESKTRSDSSRERKHVCCVHCPVCGEETTDRVQKHYDSHKWWEKILYWMKVG